MDNLKQVEETNKNKHYIANRIRTIKNNFNEE